jgi:hypothetical protein
MVKKLTDRQILRQIPAARRRAQLLHAEPWWPKAARFDTEGDALRLKLRNDVEWIIPRKRIPELRGIRRDQLRRVRISGEAIRWDEADVDLSIPGIAIDVLGTAFFSRASGAIRGAVTSKAKAEAARRNGAKGGRPRKSGAGK